MSSKKPNYVFLATIGSFVIPSAYGLWSFFTYDFINPDGAPDNAPIHAIPAAAVFGLFVFFFQLAAYLTLGKKQHSLSEPSLKPGAIYATALSAPFPVFVFFLATMPGQPYPASILQALLISAAVYAFLWSSFFSGAVVQYLLIKKHGKSF